MAVAREGINGVCAFWSDLGSRPSREGTWNHQLVGKDGREIPTTSVASLMSAHFAVKSQISRNRTWAASLRALASSSELIVKRSTTSSLYRETIVPGGFESAMDWALPTS